MSLLIKNPEMAVVFGPSASDTVPFTLTSLLSGEARISSQVNRGTNNAKKYGWRATIKVASSGASVGEKVSFYLATSDNVTNDGNLPTSDSSVSVTQAITNTTYLGAVTVDVDGDASATFSSSGTVFIYDSHFQIICVNETGDSLSGTEDDLQFVITASGENYGDAAGFNDYSFSVIRVDGQDDLSAKSIGSILTIVGGSGTVIQTSPSGGTLTIFGGGGGGSFNGSGVAGPNSSTNNGIAVFNGTNGQTIKNTTVTINPATSNMAGVAGLQATSGYFTGVLQASNLTGTNTGDQDLSGYAPIDSPTFTGTVTLPSGTTINHAIVTAPLYIDQPALTTGWGINFNGELPAVDWIIENTTASIENLSWVHGCVSQDGQTMFLLQNNYHLWRSTDGGVTWEDLDQSSLSCISVACTSNGATVWIATDNNAAYKSTDSGDTFGSVVNPGGFSAGLLMSGDGTKLCSLNGRAYSTNSGASWSSPVDGGDVLGGCISRDGSVVYLPNNSKVRTSSDLTSYTTITSFPAISTRVIACSLDGTYVLVNSITSDDATGPSTWLSSNHGSTWTRITALNGITVPCPHSSDGMGLSVSDDGKYMILGGYANDDEIAKSEDYGVTWSVQSPGGSATWGWRIALVAGDSSRFVAVPATGGGGGAATIYPYVYVNPTPLDEVHVWVDDDNILNVDNSVDLTGSLSVGGVIVNGDAKIQTTDVTTNNFSNSKHGFVPKGSGLGNLLNDSGSWITPFAAQVGASGSITTTIESPTSGIYALELGTPYSMTIRDVFWQTDSGSLAASYKIGSAYIGGLSNIAVTSSSGVSVASSSNSAPQNSYIYVAISGLSSPSRFTSTIHYVTY